jgi:enoyl-CoA hydratase
MAATYLLPSLTGHQVAARLLLTGDIVAADEALRLGLVLAVHPDDQLLPEVLKLAGSIAAASAPAVRATLGMLRSRCSAEGLLEAVQQEARMQAQCFGSEDVKEGVAAAMERRPPRFHAAAGGGGGEGGAE